VLRRLLTKWYHAPAQGSALSGPRVGVLLSWRRSAIYERADTARQRGVVDHKEESTSPPCRVDGFEINSTPLERVAVVGTEPLDLVPKVLRGPEHPGYRHCLRSAGWWGR
jgi:hypothetical protein